MQSPQLLAGGDALLFAVGQNGGVNGWNRAQIVLQSLKTGQRRTLIDGGTDPRYVPTGHLVYALGGVLFAVPFDVRRLEVTGGPVPVVEGVRRASRRRRSAVWVFGHRVAGVHPLDRRRATPPTSISPGPKRMAVARL